MKKRFRDRWLVNLGLLIIIGFLLTLALVGQKPAALPAKILGDYLQDSIDEIRILRSGKKDIHFKLVNNYWQMLSPYQTRAEDSLVRQILSISNLEVSALIDDPKTDLAHFGLQPPVVTVQLNQHRLNFGDSQPINQQRYIELDGNIMLVSDRHAGQFKAGSISYIDRHLIPQDRQLTGLRIGSEIIDLEQPSNQARSWSTMKANWISQAPATQVQQGIDIFIELTDATQGIHYIAEKREADLTLTNMQSQLEYHLPVTAADSLGLSFATQDSKVDASQDSKTDQ